MGDVTPWAKRAIEQNKFASKNSLFNHAQITHKVSKSFDGEFTQDQVYTQCERPEASRHLHIIGTFDCKSLRSGDCDSQFSRKHLTGAVKSGFEATFGHDEPFDKRDLFLNRGYFNGSFALTKPAKKPHLRGAMNGLCNIGLNHEPFKREFEECHHIGRWYGRIEAAVDLEGGELAYLTSSLALEIEYRGTPSYLEMKYIGNLEGLLIRNCTHSS